MLIFILPTGNIADYFITVFIELSVDLLQCVPLKVELARRIRRPELCLLILPQRSN
jgi:hypothetical protein